MVMLVTGELTAQRPGGSRDAQQSPFKVTGKVLDGESGTPLEYVTAVLLSKVDSSVVSGAVTDAQGMFSITARPGQFMLKIQYVSYKDRTLNDVTLNRNNLVVDIGTIKIDPDVDVLDEVVVEGERSSLVMTLDKRVFNVGKDLSNTGGTGCRYFR